MERGHRAQPLEWIAEKLIFLVSLSAILMVFLIFIFVAREALPVLLGRMGAAAAKTVIPAEEMDKHTPAELEAYLGLTDEKFKKMSHDTIKSLMEFKVEDSQEVKNKDAGLDTSSWRYLIGPHQWSDYNKPVYIWQPTSEVPKFNIIPLVIGSLKATIVALLFSVPFSLGAAIYVSQLASARFREWLKPAIEMLAGIPSVVLGFFAFIILANFLQGILKYGSRLNALVAGIALGLAIIPVMFSVAEDALTSVPRSYTQAALALGSSRWQAAWQIVLPAAIPGVFAAIVLGFGRAIGETMVVLMASGNASIVSWSILDSTRTMTATIAAEMGESVFGGEHYRILFALGVLLFAVTFVSNMVAELVINRLKLKLEGKR
jgi:phosphate transport system permease protein